MHEHCKDTILAKTLKIMLPSRRNANFQEIEDRKNEKHQAEIHEKSHVFWNIDFDFFTHLKLSCNFLTFFNDFSSSFGGFGVVWGWILGGFFRDF